MNPPMNSKLREGAAMTKELRDKKLYSDIYDLMCDIATDFKDLDPTDAATVVGAWVALFDRYAAEREKQVAKAFGGCTNCYGKGYATVNDRWHRYGTDGDIGGFEGHISGGNANAMKFCKCERGKQLSALKETTNE